jgi:hypothetical protein
MKEPPPPPPPLWLVPPPVEFNCVMTSEFSLSCFLGVFSVFMRITVWVKKWWFQKCEANIGMAVLIKKNFMS